MIDMEYPQVTVNEQFLQKLLFDRQCIDALAVQLVGGQVEAHIDLINDAGVEEYGTFEEVEQCIDGAKHSTEDYVEDLLTEFRESLYDAIRKVKVETTSYMQVRTRTETVINVDVNVSI